MGSRTIAMQISNTYYVINCDSFVFNCILGENSGNYLNLTVPSAGGGQASLLVPLPSGPDVCLKHSSGRGVGTVLTTICNADEEKYGALCYPQCDDGYESVGCCICRQKGCPPEFKDDGVATCIKPAPYGRGVGYPWRFDDGLNDKGMYRRCEAANGAGNCEKSGLIVYPKCRSGFHAVGCCICTPDCPNGMDDIGISCGKRSYGRGVGKFRLKCADNKEEDAALCYDKCQSGYYGVGPVCWQSCPSSTPDNCGVMCTIDKSTCEKHTLSIIKSAVEVGWDVFSGIAEKNVEEIVEAALETAETVTDEMSDGYC
jgi:hypothetical protein